MQNNSLDRQHDGCADDPEGSHMVSTQHNYVNGSRPSLTRLQSNPSLASGVSGPPVKATASLFMDANEIKQKVRQSLARPIYNVHDRYWDTGICQLMARSAIFEKVTLLVIAVNALWIAIDTDHNKAEVLTEAPVIFQLAEHSFCAFFCFELMIRFGAFRKKLDGLHDPWFLFDTVLVTMMVMETWILTIVLAFATEARESDGNGGGLQNASILRIARVLRLSRMARMARLLRVMPELMILIKGLVAAMRSVFFALCLLLGIVFVFAIAFTQLTPDFDFHRTYFDHVLLSMYTLLFRGALLDNVSFLINEIGDRSLPLAGLFIAFVMISALTVMNMLIGVLVEVVSSVARLENEEAMLSFVRSKMEPLVRELDTDGNSEISRLEFMRLVENPTACQTLHDVGVDPVGLVDYADFIFSDDVTGQEHPELSYTDFMEVVLELRGSNTATVKDIVDLRKFISSIFDHFEGKLDSLISRRLRSSLDAHLSPMSRASSSVTSFIETPQKRSLHKTSSNGMRGSNFSTAMGTENHSNSRHSGISDFSGIDTNSCRPSVLRHIETRRSALGESMQSLMTSIENSLEDHLQHLNAIVEAAHKASSSGESVGSPKVVPTKLSNGASRGLNSSKLDVGLDLKQIQLGEHVDACTQLVSSLHDKLHNLGASLHRPPSGMTLTKGLPSPPNPLLLEAAEDIRM